MARRRSDRGVRRLLPRRRKPSRRVEERKSLPLDERLALYILEGSQDGLTDDLDEALSARRRWKSSTAR